MSTSHRPRVSRKLTTTKAAPYAKLMPGTRRMSRQPADSHTHTRSSLTVRIDSERSMASGVTSVIPASRCLSPRCYTICGPGGERSRWSLPRRRGRRAGRDGGRRMVQDAALLGALFAAGLVGGIGDCAGMCGPFVLAQAEARPAPGPPARLGELHRVAGAALLPYHLGRLTTYAGLGTAAALLAGQAAEIGGLRWLSAALLLAGGLV